MLFDPFWAYDVRTNGGNIMKKVVLTYGLISGALIVGFV